MTRRNARATVACTGLVVALSVLAAGGCFAERVRSTVDQQKSVSITIYNSDLGLVKDVRSLRLPTGTHDLWFEGVAAQIDPTSVHIVSLDAPDRLHVLEQNFQYDLITPERLLDKYLGKEVELVRWIDGKEETVPARLIGNSGGYVFEVGGKIAINPSARVVLPSLPDGLISRPSLVWLLENRRAEHTVEASYLTHGISWKANYVAVLASDEKKLDLSGWVTIDNHSGATYVDAKLKLVAGDVNRVTPERPRAYNMARTAMEEKRQFREESFFEYHLYSLERPATVSDNQTKQISLLAANGVGVEKKYVYASQPGWFYTRMGEDATTKIGVYLGVDNTRKNGLGMALPQGVVRVYKKDAEGALQFIGEDAIDHTPTDENVRIRMGNAFDVVAERVQTEFEVLASGHLYRSSYRVSIRNHRDEDVTVSVLEAMGGDWEIEKRSHPFVKESVQRVRFDVPVKAHGATDLTFTVLVRS